MFTGRVGCPGTTGARVGTLAPMELRTDSFCATPAMRTQWYVVADATDVAGSPLGVTVLGERYVLWRGGDGAVSAAPDRCPHREAPLSHGAVNDGCLVCPYHAWSFDGDGACVAVPSSGPGAAFRLRPTCVSSPCESATASCGCAPERRPASHRRSHRIAIRRSGG